MRLSRRNWLVRLYLFNYEFLTPACADYPYTDLCHFLRVVLIWLPFKFVAVAALLSASVVWFDLWALPIAVIFAATGLVVGIVFGLAFGCKKTWRRIDDSEAFQIFKEAVRAKKQKICLIIEIVDKEKIA